MGCKRHIPCRRQISKLPVTRKLYRQSDLEEEIGTWESHSYRECEKPTDFISLLTPLLSCLLTNKIQKHHDHAVPRGCSQIVGQWQRN